MEEEKWLVAPAKNRESTDLFCLILFVFFTVVLLLIGIFCAIQGSTDTFLTPYDSDGNGCGIQHPQHPYIYFPSPQTDSLWVTTCVQQCPTSDSTQVKCKTNTVVTSCQPNNSADNLKAFHIYDTQVSRGSVCMPTSQSLRDKVIEGVDPYPLQEAIGSVLQDWSLLLLMTPIILVVSFLLILLIRLTAGYVLYVLFTLSFLAFLGFAIYMALPADDSQEYIFILKQNRTVSLIIAIISLLIALFTLIIFCAYISRIKMAVNYIESCNIFIADTYKVFIVPFILTIITLAFTYFWYFLVHSFYSMSNSHPEVRKTPFKHYRMPISMIALTAVATFYLVWSLFLLTHSADFIISGAVVNWQYERRRPLMKAVKAYLTSHVGSGMMGSFLTVMFGFYKVESAEETEESRRDQNRCCSFFEKCYGCLCCCCINFVFQCFHSAAYCFQNLSGKSYCSSSKQINHTIHDTKEHWSMISFLHNFFNDLIPIVFTVLHVLLANVFISSIEFYTIHTSNRILVLAMLALFAYSITQFFLSIYSQSIVGLFVVSEYHRRTPQHEEVTLHLQKLRKEQAQAENNNV